MPVILPNLDDRRFDDLINEGRALIPALDPDWTDHNPSEPGITLVELFAYLSDILIYRLNRVTDANTRAFLNLLDPARAPTDDLAADIRNTVLALRRPDRAVTPADFEFLARAASASVVRTVCVPRRDLAAERATTTSGTGTGTGTGTAPAMTIDARGHVSLVVLPAAGKVVADVLKAVSDYLEPRRMLTTKLHVVAPRYLKLGLKLTLTLQRDAQPADVQQRAAAALNTWFDPLTGGSDGRGWPFGRAVYLSEIYSLLDRLPGVDYVDRTGGADEFIVDAATPLIRATPTGTGMTGALAGVGLAPDQLVQTPLDPLQITATLPPPRTY